MLCGRKESEKEGRKNTDYVCRYTYCFDGAFRFNELLMLDP
jgi:hypothetical protein